MATYLELCQKTARESGIVAGTQPLSVSGQTGLLLQIVGWVADAWTEIQNKRNAWSWMHAPWSGTLTAGTGVYTAGSFGLARHGRWIGDDPVTRRYPTTLYLQAAGIADERPIFAIGYDDWLARYGRGVQVAARPVHYAVSPANELCFGPVPDAAYVARGRYTKSAQVLAANADTPECPTQFHDVIVHRARMKLAAHDEAPQQFQAAESEYNLLMGQLERHQLPALGIAATTLVV